MIDEREFAIEILNEAIKNSNFETQLIWALRSPEVLRALEIAVQAAHELAVKEAQSGQ